MSRQIQIRRGTAAENDAFTGAIGEITMGTTNKTLRVHDGETPGGTTLAKQSEIPDLTNIDYVVESQLPTAANNYTWYRKYKSGWVEQGGIKSINYTTANQTQEFMCNFAKTFADTNYTLCLSCIGGFSTSRIFGPEDLYTSKFNGFIKQGATATLKASWYACGF